MQTPTVGRIVHLHVTQEIAKGLRSQGKIVEAGEPLAAIICGVIDDETINIVAWDVTGKSFERVGVDLMPESNLISKRGYWCTWPPRD